MNILIVNHQKSQCGIYQYGINLYESLKLDSSNFYYYFETNNFQSLLQFLNKFQIDVVVFNWHSATMPWITNETIKHLQKYKLYFIHHDHELPFFENSKILINDPTQNTDNIKIFNLGRLLFQNNHPNIFTDEIVVSSFGFGFGDKGFPRVIEKVNEEFENATIRIHTPTATMVDANNHLQNITLNQCYKKVNNKNKVIFTQDYKSHDDLLKWLSESTINCFFYDIKSSRGISSCIDYALSVNVPIAITECEMFRHILNDEISIEKRSLKDIIRKGTEPLQQFKNKWSVQSFIKNFKNIIETK
jgi:hypothetical protein